MNLQQIREIYAREDFNQVLTIIAEEEGKDSYSSLPVDHRYKLHSLRAGCLYGLGKLNESLELAQQIRATHPTPDSQEYILDLIIIQLHTLRRMGKMDEALALSKEGIELKNTLMKEQRPIRSVASFGLILGAIYGQKGDLHTSLQYTQESLAIYEKIGTDVELSDCYNNLGIIYAQMGKLDDSLVNFENSLKIREKAGLHTEAAGSLGNMSHCYYLLGELKKAFDCSKRGLELRKQDGQQQDIAYGLMQMGLVSIAKGVLDEAREYYRQGLAIQEEIGDNFAISNALFNLGAVSVQKGELDEALEYLQKSLTIREQLGHQKDIAKSLAGLGNVYAMKGKLTLSQEYYEKCLIIQEDHANDIERASTLLYVINLMLSKNQLEQARQYHKQLESLQNQTPNKQIDFFAKLTKTLILIHSGRTSELNQAKLMLEDLVDADVIIFNWTMIARLALAQVYFSEYIIAGNQEILTSLTTNLENISKLAKQSNYNLILFEITLLQGKIALLDFSVDKAKSIFETVKQDAEEKGYVSIVNKCTDELTNLENYTLFDQMSDLQKAEQSTIQQHQISELLTYMQEIIARP